MPSENSPFIVYFDGSCPLCQAEIAHYRKQLGSDRLCFQDVSLAGQIQECDLSRDIAMSRFHIRGRDGQLVSGAAAFVSLWSQLPRWRWAARIAKIPGIMALLEAAYRLFLPTRPVLAWAFRKIPASKQVDRPI